MRNKAIYDAYASVVTIINDVPYDADGNEVAIVEDIVLSKQTYNQNKENMEALRQERNKRLAETDHWMFSDTPDITQGQLDYRQALRDVTISYNSLDNVVWPTKPEVKHDCFRRMAT